MICIVDLLLDIDLLRLRHEVHDIICDNCVTVRMYINQRSVSKLKSRMSKMFN